ncbi:unnamed protein product [Spirodela intermedia]|uniref:Longin domain-containing protein n=1 Tax=Spirodela intermedia TaxID=51605 RepID=A0A7I8IUU4_SPIIN|nr:unnamed protein product [Spirodela intermedia]CAA6661331.1 unnamed protein product [Spirodela intermedia]
MGQKSLIYSFVARGTVIIASYAESSGNFISIASQCLQKLPAKNNKFTYNCGNQTFNYLVEDGYTYCVVASESVGTQLPMAFLDRVKEDFIKRYGGGKATTAPANSLDRDFANLVLFYRPKLKNQMQYCVDHPEELSKLARVKDQVLEVKGVMMDNIQNAQDFKNNGIEIKKKMWMQNMKIKLVILAIIIVLILIIVLSICGGSKC